MTLRCLLVKRQSDFNNETKFNANEELHEHY